MPRFSYVQMRIDLNRKKLFNRRSINIGCFENLRNKDFIENYPLKKVWLIKTFLRNEWLSGIKSLLKAEETCVLNRTLSLSKKKVILF